MYHLLPITRAELCILWLHTANLFLYLSSLLTSPKAFGGSFARCALHHTSDIYGNMSLPDTSSERISYLKKTTDMYLLS